MKNNKVTYSKMKLRQKEDLHSKRIVNTVYRNVSTFFAFIFVKLGISPNAISISSFFICVLGFIFLSIGTYLSFVIGIMFFILFRIMDDTDGEVARATNKQSLEGLYFEGLQDYIYYSCLGLGLGIGLFRLYQSEIHLYLGFLLTFVFIVGYAMTDSLKPVLRKAVIDKKISKNLSDKDIRKKLWDNIDKHGSWTERNIFLRMFGIHPSGLVYSIEFIGPILVVLALIEYLVSIYINFPQIVYSQTIGILSIYLFVVGIGKLIRIVSFITKMVKNKYITNFLNEL